MRRGFAAVRPGHLTEQIEIHVVSQEQISERQSAVLIVERMRAEGFAALFAGGCVRDELLGRTPDDYDVVTNATPEQIAPMFLGRTSHVGAHFGVVIVRERGNMVEVATFRTDGAYSDKRRPDSVVFSTPEHDALRRDFTVNALFLDPLSPPNTPGASGEVIDYVGGIPDLASRLIRAVGNPDQRLAEDHLRALRAARLAAKLGFEIEPQTAEAIRRHAASLAGLSRERIGDEVRRMMAHPSRLRAAGHMRFLGVDVPALLLDAGLFSQARGPLETLAGLKPDAAPDQALAAYAIDLGIEVTAASGMELGSLWRTALCLSNEEQAALRHMFSHLAELESGFLRLAVAAQKRLCAKWKFSEALEIAVIRDPALGARLIERVDELSNQPGGVAPEPWITGDDLIRLGLPPGPKFKRVLDAMYDAQLDGTTPDPASANALAMRMIGG